MDTVLVCAKNLRFAPESRPDPDNGALCSQKSCRSAGFPPPARAMLRDISMNARFGVPGWIGAGDIATGGTEFQAVHKEQTHPVGVQPAKWRLL
jgi:hypothetical protein